MITIKIEFLDCVESLKTGTKYVCVDSIGSKLQDDISFEIIDRKTQKREDSIYWGLLKYKLDKNVRKIKFTYEGVYTMIEELKKLIEICPKTEDAFLVLKHFKSELNNSMAMLYVKQNPQLLIDEAKRLESLENKKNKKNE